MEGFAVLQFFETDRFFLKQMVFFLPGTVWLITIWSTKEWNADGTAGNRSLLSC